MPPPYKTSFLVNFLRWCFCTNNIIVCHLWGDASFFKMSPASIVVLHNYCCLPNLGFMSTTCLSVVEERHLEGTYRQENIPSMTLRIPTLQLHPRRDSLFNVFKRRWYTPNSDVRTWSLEGIHCSLPLREESTFPILILEYGD